MKTTTSLRRLRHANHRNATQHSLQTELLEGRQLLAADLADAFASCVISQRETLPADVNGDQFVTGIDALLVLNALPDGQDCASSDSHDGIARPLLDVSGDGALSPLDALLVLNELSRPGWAAAEPAEGEGDELTISLGAGTELIYNAATGNLTVTTTSPLSTLEVVSESGIFTGAAAENLGGDFDVDTDLKVFKFDKGGFDDTNFGNVAQAGLTLDFLEQDLSVNGTILGGGLVSNFAARFTPIVTNDAGGIYDVKPGDVFYMEIRATDVRPITPGTPFERGFQQAFVNVHYDPAVLSLVSVEPPDGVPSVLLNFDGSQPGLISDVGAEVDFSSNEPIAHITFQVLEAAGKTTLTFSHSDRGVKTFDEADVVPPIDVHFESREVNVVEVSHPDVISLAKALTAEGAVLYGASWSREVTEQKALFEDGQNYLQYVAAFNADRTSSQAGDDNNILILPTWVFADGSRLEGVQSLDTLASKLSGDVAYQSEPSMLPLADVSLSSGSPFHVPLDAFAPDHGELTFDVTSSNPDVKAELITGTSLYLDVADYGSMIFKLFDDEAPRVVERMKTLTASDFYNDITFHRVIAGFVVQAGDPTGTGAGGSNLGDFDDQFDVDLQHNRTGVLSMAKAGDDTNDSQFFITEGPQRHLDFNHSVFGQLVEGEDVRAAISVTPVTNSKPRLPVKIASAEIQRDIENGLLRLSAPEGFTGEADIQVTVTNADGESIQQTFHVVATPDTSNSAPFLADIDAATIAPGQTINGSIHGIDAEGDALVYAATVHAALGSISIDFATGEYSLSIPDDLTVTSVPVTFRVTQTANTATYDKSDLQVVNFVVEATPLATPSAPLLISTPHTQLLRDVFFTNNPNILVSSEALQAGASAIWDISGTLVTTTVTAGGIATVEHELTTDGQYSVTLQQQLGSETSETSLPLFVILDRQAPAEWTADFPTSITLGQSLSVDIDHVEEATESIRYELGTTLDGLTIDATTGAVNWTPTIAQLGSH
ncbi:MAG: peptidylprolyl isomerase, partial [Planctomycetales bacterium]|nr:peptidylprolyl isomerase [Planctomycetales bacterium]